MMVIIPTVNSMMVNVVLILIDQFGDGSKPSFAYLGYIGYIYIDEHPFAS
jgi:hypothetical protein